MKGQVYSLVSVLIVVPLMLYITIYLPASESVKYVTIERIVSDQLHMVEKSIEQDFEKAVEISGKRALIAATGDVISRGVSMDDAKAGILELLTNGSLDGNATIVMYNNTLSDWNNKIRDLVKEFNMGLSEDDISVSNVDGTNIAVSVHFRINMTDKLGISRIDRDFYKVVTVSLEDIEDPIFPLNTGGYVGRSIHRHPYPYHTLKIGTGTLSSGNCIGNVTFNQSDPSPGTKILVTNDSTGVSGFHGVISENTATPSVSCFILGFASAVEKVNYTVNGSGYDEVYIDNDTMAAWSLPINDAIESGYYASFGTSGPDIFSRLEGGLSPAANSFETFVNIPKLILADVPIKPNQVSVAYLYFSGAVRNGVAVRGISLRHDWFRADAEIAARYNLTELMP